MARTPDIQVSGPVLKWAREQRGLAIEIAAKRGGVSEAKLTDIEEGLASPSLAQLRKLAEAYRRPLIVMLLDEVPTTFQPLTDYRRLPESQLNEYSAELRDEVRRAVQERNIFKELSAEMGTSVEVPALPPGNTSNDILASRLRELLGITATQQRHLANRDEAFNYWRTRIEELGILVLEASRVKMSEMRGFSLTDGLPLVIVLNGQDSPRGKIFSLLHEMCHLCLRDSGVCDLQGGSNVEVFCNAVAGATLLPESFVRELPVVEDHKAENEWTSEELDAITSVAGGASQEAVLRRLVQLGIATSSEYEKQREDFLAAYEEMRQKRNRKSKGGPPPYRIQLRDRGRPFIRSVFNAYGDGFINLSEVTDLVGLRVKHLSNLQNEAFK